MKLFRLIPVLCLSLLVGGVQIFAQSGTSSASMSRTQTLSEEQNKTQPSKGRKSRANSGYNDNVYEPAPSFVAPDKIAVEEFVNYHKHRLPLPKVGQAVAVDVRWGNDVVSASQPEAVLQVGFTTSEVNDREDLRPLNLALVIDRSFSMEEANKINRVKQALHELIDKLREEDIVSIVLFAGTAEVAQPAARVGDGEHLRRLVDSIELASATNINAGLMLGYREALRNYRAGQTNRVILLTDGMTNTGVTDLNQIARNSQEYNRQGIDLSTIGLGVSLDEELLRTLAKSGRGLFHFIADNEDIEKVFVNEVQSLMSPVARNVELTVDFMDSSLRLEKVYGYAPRITRTGVKIALDDMNNGLTGVALLKFRAADLLRYERAGIVVRLSYYDIKQKRNVEQTQTVILRNAKSRERDGNLLADAEVKKNYTIALLAQSLADMKTAADRRDYVRAETILNSATSAAFNYFPTMEDADISRVLKIVEDYQTNLQTYNRSRKPLRRID